MLEDLGRSLDAVRLIAERQIEEALADGEFDNLPRRGYIDCSASGERFLRQWFEKKLNAESTAERD